MTLKVEPALAGRDSPVQIELAVHAQRAPGALGYLLRYGDGTTSGSGAVPQFCLSGAGRPARQTWRLKHRYRESGRYAVSVSAYVNCTRDHASTMTSIVVR